MQVPESERPIYDFEFTSSMFELNSGQQLVVRTENLDRDSPNQPVLTLQVTLWRSKLRKRVILMQEKIQMES